MVRTAKKELKSVKIDKKQNIDEKTLLKSFEMIKKLSNDVKSIDNIKENLKSEIKNLTNRIEVFEKSNKSNKSVKSNNNNDNNKLKQDLKLDKNILNILKDEILNEFSLILDKLNLKNIKKEIYKDVEKTINLEIEKFNSRIDLKNKKSNKLFNQKLSDLESKLLETITSNQKLKKELKLIEKNDSKILIENFEENIKNLINRKLRLITKKLNENEDNLNNLNSKLELNESNIKKLNTKINSIRNNLKKVDFGENEKIIKIESLISDLEKNNKIILDEISLYKKKNVEQDEKIKKSLDLINLERDSQKELLVEKYNNLVEQIENIEEKFKINSKNDILSYKKKLEKEIQLLIEILKKDIEKTNEINNKNIKNEFKKINKEKEKLFKNINSKFSEIAIKNSLENENNSKKIDENLNLLKKSFEELKISLLSNVKDYISQLDSELLILKNNISKFDKEKDFMNKKLVEYEKKINISLEHIKKEKDSQREFISSNIGSIIEKNDILIKEYNNEINKIKKDLEKNIESNLSNNLEEYNAKREQVLIEFNNIKLKIEDLINEKIGNLTDRDEDLKKDYIKFKDELLGNFKKYLNEVDNKLNHINELISNLINEKDDFKNEIKNLFEEDKNNLKENLINLNNELRISLLENIDLVNKDLKVEIEANLNEILSNINEIQSKNLIKLNEFKSKITIENKEQREKLSSELDSKFKITKEQFDKDLNESKEKFNSFILEKENEFKSKIDLFEEDKEKLLTSFNKFKEEFTKEFKNYSFEIESQIENLKLIENNFFQEKKDFLADLNKFSKEKKEFLEKVYDNLESKLKDFINNEREILNDKDNSFREVFIEKINNLEEVNSKRFLNFEEKVDKLTRNLIKDLVSDYEKKFNLLSEDLNSKNEILSKSFENLEAKENDFFENLKVEEEKLSERIEERLTGLEKQLNRRFLDFDSEFSSFKGVVIDEVEDLMKEINALIKTKVDLFDKNLIQLSKINNEATNKLNKIEEVKNTLTNEVLDMRDEIKDIKVKTDILRPEQHTMSHHIEYMRTYEEQLISLIHSLKQRGIDDDAIRSALINKGHPRFYVSMILNNFYEIYN